MQAGSCLDSYMSNCKYFHPSYSARQQYIITSSMNRHLPSQVFLSHENDAATFAYYMKNCFMNFL